MKLITYIQTVLHRADIFVAVRGRRRMEPSSGWIDVRAERLTPARHGLPGPEVRHRRRPWPLRFSDRRTAVMSDLLLPWRRAEASTSRSIMSPAASYTKKRKKEEKRKGTRCEEKGSGRFLLENMLKVAVSMRNPNATYAGMKRLPGVGNGSVDVLDRSVREVLYGNRLLLEIDGIGRFFIKLFSPLRIRFDLDRWFLYWTQLM